MILPTPAKLRDVPDGFGGSKKGSFLSKPPDALLRKPQFQKRPFCYVAPRCTDNIDIPAWARIPTAVVGTSDCGDFDVFEVLGLGNFCCKSIPYVIPAGGLSDWSERPFDGWVKTAVIIGEAKEGGCYPVCWTRDSLLRKVWARVWLSSG